jgi:histidine triad (HIT) family protein
MTCVFCGIAAGTVEGSIVFEDEQVVAFLDLHPAADHHVLVVPKRHAADLMDVAPEDAAAMMNAARQIARAILALDAQVEGINLWMANGAAAGQDVSHAHLHVIARRTEDSIVVDMPAVRQPSRGELNADAAALRELLDIEPERA